MTKRIIYLSFLLIAVGLISCKKSFFDINTDPSNPVNVSVSQLLPTAESSLAGTLGIAGSNSYTLGLGEVLGVYVHQITVRDQPDQYAALGSYIDIANSWDNLYAGSVLGTVGGATYYQGVLQNLQVIIDQGTAEGNMKYVGIAKILKAYTYSQMVDIWGNVPFSQALQLQGGIQNPKFDSGSVIYPQLFTLIDSGISNINNTTALNPISPGTDDIIYGGSVSNWERAANTIKLKLLVQQRLIKNVTADVTALETADDMISSTSQDFMFRYGKLGASDDRNPGFADYYNPQKVNYISPWFYSIMKGYNPRIFTGVQDPRVPYYFYNQLGKYEADRDGNRTEYRDSGFVSIIFGTIGPNSAFSQQKSVSVLGMYPVGGRYDEGDSLSVDASSGTGAAPFRFITYADRLYLEAELIKAGVISGDAAAKLKAAITESMKQVDFVDGLVGSTQTVPTLVGSGPDTVYINSVMAAYAANASQQMEIIMTEKWIAAFDQCEDQYTDYRRTGFPVLFNPNDPTVCPGGSYQPPINGDPSPPPLGNPGAQPAVPVECLHNYPLSLPFGQNELDANQNAPAQKSDPSTYKVFWIP